MTIDLNKYRRVIKPLVKVSIDRNPDKDPLKMLTIIAEETSCHIIAVGYFMAELYGMTPELEAKIGRLEKIYSYPIVTNKKEG